MKREEFLKLTRDYMRDRNQKIVSYKNLSEILDCMFDAFLVGLKRDHEVSLKKFARFNVRERYDRDWYNPKTNEHIMRTVPRGIKTKWCDRFYKEIDKDD